MSKENRRPVPLTKKDFFEIEECKCGKTPFRYHNTSKNEFIVKCNTHPEEYDLKSRKWTKCKRQPCDLLCAYYGERPIFEQIKKTLIRRANAQPDYNKVLEEKLRLLFQFVTISNHTSTLDEINILVKNNLKKEPRKTYYSPTTSYFMPVVGYETLEDYRDRIFSEKIINRTTCEEVIDHEPVVFVKSPYLERKNVRRKAPKVLKPVKPIKSNNNFIVVSDDESECSEINEQSDNETETSRDLSDYEDIEELAEEIEEVYEEENYDDCDDAGGGEDDYDD
jgi:hypothetical protein